MKQIISILLATTLMLPAPLFAQETSTDDPPTVAEINEGEPAPFTGVLLNSTAAAQMLANQKFLEAGCKLKLDFEITKLQAKHDLLFSGLEASLKSTQQKYDSIMQIKDEEIERLNNIVLENSNDYSHWWAAGGFLAGTLVALGIFFAAAEAN